MAQAEIGLYTDPEVYDILHAPGTAGEVRGLERIWKRWGTGSVQSRTRGTWFEPACGTARYLRHSAERGHRVLGVDSSAPMIEYARNRLRDAGFERSADLRVGNMARLPRDWRGRVDFAFCLINSIRHLTSDRAVAAHLRAVASALRPGGIYCIGITLTSYGMEFPSEDVWVGRRGPCRVRQIVQFVPPLTPADERARAERVYSHLMVTRARGRDASTEHRDSRYLLRTYSRRQWESLIARSPLRTKAIVNEDGAPLNLSPSGYGIWVLEKATSTVSA
jgi:SAM-dependent methyltransferase